MLMQLGAADASKAARPDAKVSRKIAVASVFSLPMHKAKTAMLH